jgi:predicted RNase H-like HicB family nuclease
MSASLWRYAMKAKHEADNEIVAEQLDEADGGGWLASVPALLGCYGNLETRAAAVEDVLAAIEEWKDAARRLGRDVPGPAAPGQWRQRVPRIVASQAAPARCRRVPTAASSIIVQSAARAIEPVGIKH